MSRGSVVVTGLVGLSGAVILTALCIFVTGQGWLPVLVHNPVYILGLLLFLLVFSIAEIPLMIYSIRRIVASSNPRARYVALLVNSGYTFFAAVYAAPFILLTGRPGLGAAMAGLSLVRFVTAVIFLPTRSRAP